jgi:hypothetical protein
MRGLVVRWVIGCAAVAPLLFGVADTPQDAASAGKLAEAQVYASYARDAYACDGDVSPVNPVAEATKWTLKAIATAQAVRAADADLARRATSFLSRQNATLSSLQKWELFLKDGQKTVEAALSRGGLQRVEAAVADGDGPACDPRLERLRALVKTRRDRFRALVEEGDHLSASSPREALAKYRDAQRLDRDDSSLQDKIRGVARRR